MSQRNDDARRLLNSMTDVDDRYVQEALHTGRIRKHNQKAGILKFQRAAVVIAAAAACGLIAVAAGRFGLLRRPDSASPTQESAAITDTSTPDTSIASGSSAESASANQQSAEKTISSSDSQDASQSTGTAEDSLNAEDSMNDEASDSTQMAANPYQEVGSLSEAASITGFTLSVPEGDSSFPNQVIHVVNQSTIQVDYATSDGSETEYSVRKAAGSDDISGDYNSYENSEQRTVNGAAVTLKGNGDTWSVAVWTANGYTYAVNAEDHPMSEDRILEIIGEVE